MKTTITNSVIFILFASMLLTACGVIAPPHEPTPTATSAPTATPEPTATPTPRPTPDYTATVSFKSTSTAEAEFSVVKTELDKLGVPMENGQMAWQVNDVIPMTIDTHDSFVVLPLVDEKKFADFILHSKLSWDSTSGLAGCGVIFRSEDDYDQGGRYAFYLMRLQFQPGWDMEYIKYGYTQEVLTGKTLFTDIINDEKWSSNEITLIVKGSEFTPYINGQKMKTVTNTKLEKGIVGLITWQESGVTDCEFSDNWLWVIQ